MLKIKDNPYKVKEMIFTSSENYTAFPSQNECGISYNENQLLPLGVINYSIFDDSVSDQVLLAFPVVEMSEEPYTVYTLKKGVWELNEDQECYLDSYLPDFVKAKEFYKKNAFLQDNLPDKADESNKSMLIRLGAHPLVGCNWDEYFWDEGDNEALFDAIDTLEKDPEDKEALEVISREIVFIEDNEEYTYIGHIRSSSYTESDTDLFYFYQPKLKKVIVCADFS